MKPAPPRHAWWTPLVLALAATAIPVAGSGEAPKSLRRFHDPVLLKTSQLTALPDRRTANLRLYSASSGVLAPIPFQFDERNNKGEVVFPDGNAERESIFDENDELVFMAKDTGDHVERVAFPATSDAALEIEVTDPITDERGWVYLLHFPDDPPPRSPVTYASFDRETNRARALFYTMKYFPERNFFIGMRIAPIAGGTGENILDRMKIRINPTFSLLLARWSPTFTEEDFSVKIDGIKNGPVRAIRRVRTWLDLGNFFPKVPGGTVYTNYYFSSFTTPSKMSFPWLVLKTLRDFRFVGVSDFRNSAIGMTYWDGANPEGLRFTGHNRAAVNADEDHDWWVLSGDGGTCLHVLIIPEEWTESGIVRGTVFVDDETASDDQGLESEPGSHAVGYSLKNVASLRRAGDYQMNLATIILPKPYEPGDEVEPMEMFRHPLQAEVRPVE